MNRKFSVIQMEKKVSKNIEDDTRNGFIVLWYWHEKNQPREKAEEWAAVGWKRRAWLCRGRRKGVRHGAINKSVSTTTNQLSHRHRGFEITVAFDTSLLSYKSLVLSRVQTKVPVYIGWFTVLMVYAPCGWGCSMWTQLLPPQQPESVPAFG